MAGILYSLIVGTFILVPVMLAIFFFVARTSDGWSDFTLDSKLLRRTEAWGGLVFILMIVAAAASG
jgi:hypothetical protein